MSCLPCTRVHSLGECVQSLNPESKLALAALAIAHVAGLIFLGLGATGLILQAMGTPIFVSALTIGGAVSLLSGAGLIKIAIAKYKEEQHVEGDAVAVTYQAPRLQLGIDAVAFARQQIEENADTQPHIFKNRKVEIEQPRNPEIAILMTLFLDKFLPAIDQEEENGDAHINALDETLKIAYAISYLSLNDLSIIAEEKNRHPMDILTDPDFHPYQTFYHIVTFYQQIRELHPLQEEFYIEGSVENSWRELYNIYCDQVRERLSKEEMLPSQMRPVNWRQWEGRDIN